MSELDDKLNTILSNPQMMQQIMNLAKTLNSDTNVQPQNTQHANTQSAAPPMGISPTMLNKFTSIMQHGTIDQQQQSLLKALSPYLSRQKIQKLEKAMHAAKMAALASEMLNANYRSQYPGR